MLNGRWPHGLSSWNRVRDAIKCLKCESRSSHFQTGEGPSRGLLRDYEPSEGTFSSTNRGCEAVAWCLTLAHAARRASAAHSTLRLQPAPSTAAASSHPARTQHTPTQPSFIVFGEGLLIDEMKAPSSAFPLKKLTVTLRIFGNQNTHWWYICGQVSQYKVDSPCLNAHLDLA